MRGDKSDLHLLLAAHLGVVIRAMISSFKT